jgi:hypothetical protein
LPNSAFLFWAEGLSAEQIYQRQLALWLQQNQQGGGGQLVQGVHHVHIAHGNIAAGEDAEDNVAKGNADEGMEAAPPLINFQAILAE